ncbi:MAG: hypothetical protein ACXWCO_00725 [Caldimonas sp.]
MNTVSFSAFLNQVMPSCPDVPEDVAIDAIRNATIELLEQSHWLLYTLAPMTGIAGVSSYPIDIPDETDLIRINTLTYDNLPMFAKSEDELRAIYPYFDWTQITGLPRYYLRDPDDNTSIIICPTPQLTEANALTGRAAIKPTRSAKTVDMSVYERWLMPIAAGAKAKLMRIPAQSFTNGVLSAANELEFRRGISEAKIERNRGLERATLVMRPPRFI